MAAICLEYGGYQCVAWCADAFIHSHCEVQITYSDGGQFPVINYKVRRFSSNWSKYCIGSPLFHGWLGALHFYRFIDLWNFELLCFGSHYRQSTVCQSVIFRLQMSTVFCTAYTTLKFILYGFEMGHPLDALVTLCVMQRLGADLFFRFMCHLFDVIIFHFYTILNVHLPVFYFVELYWINICGGALLYF